MHRLLKGDLKLGVEDKLVCCQGKAKGHHHTSYHHHSGGE